MREKEHDPLPASVLGVIGAAVLAGAVYLYVDNADWKVLLAAAMVPVFTSFLFMPKLWRRGWERWLVVALILANAGYVALAALGRLPQ